MFALLEHDTTPDGAPRGDQPTVHWDLIIEAPGCERLPTWRLAANPLDSAAEIPAERIEDHRRVYLEYEGVIAGGRGTVRRLDRGGAEIEQLTDDKLVVTLGGGRLRGRFAVSVGPGEHVVFRRL